MPGDLSVALLSYVGVVRQSTMPTTAQPAQVQGRTTPRRKKPAFGDSAYQQAMKLIEQQRRLDFEKPGYGFGRGSCDHD